MTYFVQCPDCGFDEFETIEKRDEAASACIEHHLDDGWSEEVTSVVSGVINERATQTDLVKRPEKLDDDNEDENGEWWPSEWDYKCSYVMTAEAKTQN